MFFAYHGKECFQAKSTLYNARPGIPLVIRTPTTRALPPCVYDELFSSVYLVTTLLELTEPDMSADIDSVSHTGLLRASDNHISYHAYTTKYLPRLHMIRLKQSAQRNTAISKTTRTDHC
ncbi:hypothetical protein ABFA25_04000 [Mycobacterium lepromatosis]